MDEVMQLARESSNRQYSPPAAEPSASNHGQESTNGNDPAAETVERNHDDDDGGGGASQSGEAKTTSGEAGGSTGSSRSRKAIPSSTPANNSKGGRKRKLSQSQRISPPPVAPEDGQPTDQEPQGHPEHVSSQAEAAEEQSYAAQDDSTLKATAAAWIQHRLNGHQDQAHQYNMYAYSDNIAGPSNLAAATAAAAAAAAAATATANSNRLPLHGEGGEDDNQAQDSSPPPQGSFSSTSGNRALSSSKRAAQNRAAQRAFRERRDKHVKELETTATHFAQLQADWTALQARYGEALALIEHLRRENELLKTSGGGGAGVDDQPPQGDHVTGEEGGRNENPIDGLEAVANVAAGAARLAAASEQRQAEEEQSLQGEIDRQDQSRHHDAAG